MSTYTRVSCDIFHDVVDHFYFMFARSLWEFQRSLSDNDGSCLPDSEIIVTFVYCLFAGVTASARKISRNRP